MQHGQEKKKKKTDEGAEGDVGVRRAALVPERFAGEILKTCELSSLPFPFFFYSVSWLWLRFFHFIRFPNSDPFICCLDAFIILCGLCSLHLLHLLVINFLVFIFYSSMHSVCVSLDCVGRLFPANVHVHFFFCLFCKYVFDKIMSPQGSIQSYSVFILLNLNVNKATYSHSKLPHTNTSGLKLQTVWPPEVISSDCSNNTLHATSGKTFKWKFPDKHVTFYDMWGRLDCCNIVTQWLFG